MLKPQDIVVLLKVYGLKGEWTYSELAKSLNMSSLEVHAALKRCSTSGLYNDKRRRVLKPALEEFLVHGLRVGKVRERELAASELRKRLYNL